MFYLPVHTMLLIKFVLWLVKRVLHLLLYCKVKSSISLYVQNTANLRSITHLFLNESNETSVILVSFYSKKAWYKHIYEGRSFNFTTPSWILLIRTKFTYKLMLPIDQPFGYQTKQNLPINLESIIIRRWCTHRHWVFLFGGV